MINVYKYVSALYKVTVNNYGALQRNVLKTYALPPLSARILLTYKCNCVCHFCNARFPSKSELTLNDLDGILRQIPKTSSLTFSGGEITLLKDFLPMMKLATKRHNVQIVTNGSAFQKNSGMIKELIDCGIWSIAFSVDVPNHTHDKIRGHEGLLQNITEAIKEIKEIRRQKRLIKPLVHINSVILRETIPCLPELIKFCIELGVDYLSFGGLDAINFDEHDWNSFREKLSEAVEISRRSKFPVTLTAEVEATYNALKNYSGSLKKGIPEGIIQMSNFACYAPWSVLMIEPDGTAHICRDGVSHGMANNCEDGMKKHNPFLAALGNIKSTPLKELWNNQIAKDWRKAILDMKELPRSCLTCCVISRVK